jgi:cholesterol transport system auxiliary component
MLAGCFGQSAVEEHFYSLSGPRMATEKGSGPRLLVSELSAAPGYDSQRLAYRVSTHELRYYLHRQWISEPTRMLGDMLIRHLKASGRFSQVARSEKLRDPDAVLDTTIDAIEEVDLPDGWLARLAMSFQLRRPDSEQVLLRHTFDVSMPCAKRHPAEVAKTVSEIFARESERLGRRLGEALARR